MVTSIKKLAFSIWNILQYALDTVTFHLIQIWDQFEREESNKKLHPDSYKFGRFKLWFGDTVLTKVDKRRSTIREQQAIIRNLLSGLRYGRNDMDTLIFIANSHHFRPITKVRFKQLLKLRYEKDLSDSLKGLDILEEDYVALIAVAEENTKFDEVYLTILEDLEDRGVRAKAFRKMMSYPIITALTVVGMEIFVALYMVPMFSSTTLIEDFSSAPTIHSYVLLRDFIVNPDYTIVLYPILVLLAGFLIYNLNSTKWLIDLLLLMIPKLNTIIIQWEISKMFNSLRALSITKNHIYDNADRAVRVVKNRVIRSSLQKDIKYNTEFKKMPNFYDMFEHSVYIEPFVLEQFRFVKENNASPNPVLEAIYKENKDVMKDVMETPGQILGILVSIIIGVYIILRLLPLYPELTVILDEMY